MEKDFMSTPNKSHSISAHSSRESKRRTLNKLSHEATAFHSFLIFYEKFIIKWTTLPMISRLSASSILLPTTDFFLSPVMKTQLHFSVILESSCYIPHHLEGRQQFLNICSIQQIIEHPNVRQCILTFIFVTPSKVHLWIFHLPMEAELDSRNAHEDKKKRRELSQTAIVDALLLLLLLLCLWREWAEANLSIVDFISHWENSPPISFGSFAFLCEYFPDIYI